MAGLFDDKQRLCFALALGNGKDPLLKERLFGLTNSEGNHGEDVKEYYFYLDSTPTHSYMKFLSKYAQAAAGESRKTTAAGTPFATKFEKTLAARLREAIDCLPKIELSWFPREGQVSGEV